MNQSAFTVVDRLLRDVPSLRPGRLPNAADIARARDWAYGRIVAASPQATLDHHAPGLSADAMDRAMRDRRAGVKCGGAAMYFKLLLEAMGFAAYALNMGDPAGRGTHVLNIVPVEDRGRPVFSIQDAYLNFTIMDVHGGVVDYRDAVRIIRAGVETRFRVLRGRTTKRWMLFRARGEFEALTENDPEGVAPRLARDAIAPLPMSDGQLMFWTDLFSPHRIEQDPLCYDGFRRWVHARLGRMRLTDYFLFPVGTSGEDIAESLVFPERSRAPVSRPAAAEA